MSWQQYAKFYLSVCKNNSEYKKLIMNPDHKLTLDGQNWSEKQVNQDIKIYKDTKDLISLLSDRKLITTRLGCVESAFIVKYLFNIDLRSHLDTKSWDDIDRRMKTNAGFYYKNEKDKKEVIDWWVKNSVELVRKSTLTSSFNFLKFDIALWALLDIKGTFYNYVDITQIILKNSGDKKILYVGSARKSIEKAFKRGVQNAWKFNIPNFSLYIQDTPQTTLGCNYPDNSIKETCEKIVDNIVMRFSDFDTAIFGCGAYGPPIINMLSKTLPNKNLIYLGSDCYKMFGIFNHAMKIPESKDVIPENWIEVEEKIDEKFKNIDEGRYWKI
jgi:hypothetical protein